MLTKKLKRFTSKLSKSLIVTFLLISHANALDIGNKVVVGSFEKITILPGEITFKAKLDTGAKNSSMHATDIDFFY